ncbi:NAD(P)H-dependent oxidoreductase [Micromonospora sp. WMMA1363]|uniref:NADPH-dependent FMN reductase n=1 Tax=Micromonospora sp. WMMA1363 TaxID=3053985 RepID=UPI00259C77B8|nr:NAD(P)H-dependent oxidoreductase [Micromonospora sp. WMMA1363]MDM4719449.1 NAD(P)H-dependent oxidoreductase [Micromonospora sp. WMMA1363]
MGAVGDHTEATGPLVVGIGGTMRPGSSTERAVRAVLSAAEAAGAHTLLLGASALQLPLYLPGETRRTVPTRQLIAAVRRADGLVIGTPAYHGGVSGLVKNALDYIEDLREAPRPYLHGRAVGCVVTARGPQAASALAGLRAVVHALRGWPTPLGVTVNMDDVTFASDGASTNPHISWQLATMGRQVVEFARRRTGALT